MIRFFRRWSTCPIPTSTQTDTQNIKAKPKKKKNTQHHIPPDKINYQKPTCIRLPISQWKIFTKIFWQLHLVGSRSRCIMCSRVHRNTKHMKNIQQERTGKNTYTVAGAAAALTWFSQLIFRDSILANSRRMSNAVGTCDSVLYMRRLSSSKYKHNTHTESRGEPNWLPPSTVAFIRFICEIVSEFWFRCPDLLIERTP